MFCLLTLNVFYWKRAFEKAPKGLNDIRIKQLYVCIKSVNSCIKHSSLLRDMPALALVNAIEQ